MFGPSFALTLRTVSQQCYKCSPLLLQDIFMAISPAIRLAKRKARLGEQLDVAKGTISLLRLRTARITEIQEAVSIMLLGQTLAAFDLLTYSIDPVCIFRHSLMSVQPWYEKLAKIPLLDTVTITPIFWDTVHCLIKRQLPVIKILLKDHATVDRTAGSCTTLLPIFYDL
jgi:hypothetical protein